MILVVSNDLIVTFSPYGRLVKTNASSINIVIELVSGLSLHCILMSLEMHLIKTDGLRNDYLLYVKISN